MKLDFQVELEKARDRARASEYSEVTVIGAYDDFAQEDLLEPEAKIGVEEGQVLLLECPLKAHNAAANMLTYCVMTQLTEQVNVPKRRFLDISPTSSETFVNTFECTKRYGKEPDGCLVDNSLGYSRKYDLGLLYCSEYVPSSVTTRRVICRNACLRAPSGRGISSPS